MSPTLLAALGPLAPLVVDGIRDIGVAGDGRVWRRTTGGFERTELTLTPRETRHIGVGLIELGGGRVDDAKPLGDSAIAGEVRAHLALPPIARVGPLLSLRFPRANPITERDIRQIGRWSWSDLRYESVLVVGATGSGKTSVAEMLLAHVPPTERIVVIEDIPEMTLRHPHAIALATRAPNTDGAGAVTMGSLVRESLRMSPDRLVIGEVRGREIVELLLALTAGHRGLATVHAQTLDDVPGRLCALGMVAGIDHSTVLRLASLAFTRVILCRREIDGFTADLAVVRPGSATFELDR